MNIIRTKPSDWPVVRKGVFNIEAQVFEEDIRYEEEDFESFERENAINYIVKDNFVTNTTDDITDSKIIGYLMSCPIENDDRYEEDEHFGRNDTIHVESMALLPECHGKGIGKALFERFLEDAKVSGFKRVVLDATSPQMIGLATKYDFKKIKFEEEWQGRTSWFMEKLI
jgi:GNAT superfamily N-acetyltransferase